MDEDTIVTEVREARRRIMTRHGDDLQSLFRELKEHERDSGRQLRKGRARKVAQAGAGSN